MITIGKIHTVQLGNPDDSGGAKLIKCIVFAAELQVAFNHTEPQYQILYMEKGQIYNGLYCSEKAPDFKEADLYCTCSLEYNEQVADSIKETLTALEKDPSNKFMIE